MSQIAHISEFLTVVEGPRQRRGYVPCYLKSGGTANYRGQASPANYTAMGASGTTIATGCDLGQTDAATLREYGLDESIIQQYVFYIGKKRNAALNALYERPLFISMEDAEATDHAVHGGYLDKYVRPFYDRYSNVPFDDVPAQAQDVIMSCCFQKGCNGVKRDWPKLWSYLITQNWKKAVWELRNGFTQYKTRRRTEGDHLAQLLA